MNKQHHSHFFWLRPSFRALRPATCSRDPVSMQILDSADKPRSVGWLERIVGWFERWSMPFFRGFLVFLGSSLFMCFGVAHANEFVFSPRTLQWKAINDNGEVVRTGHGSGGRSYCPDIHRSCRTPVGTFHVISKGGSDCRSSLYPVGRGGSPMPYCMFFSKYYAVHGSYHVPDRNASHGCIRVLPSEARWLSKNFMHVGTTIVVKPY